MTPSPAIDVTIDDPRWQDLTEGAPAAFIAPVVEKTVHAVLPGATMFEDVSVVLTNDTEIQILNRDYRGRDKPTNVLSFPQHTPEELAAAGMPLMLGDIVLAYETVIREAEEQSKPARDHLAHLLVHGTLHLLGHDHEDESEAAAMEALETEILASMGIENPYKSGRNMA